MKTKLSKRLVDIVDALPLKPGIRVLEIGCGPGAMAREMANRVGNGYVLAIDRSAKAIQQAVSKSKMEIKAGTLSFLQAAIESFELPADEKKFDMAVAIRVGALDGRHTEIEQQSLINIANALTKSGKLFIDKGTRVKELPLDKYKGVRNR